MARLLNVVFAFSQAATSAGVAAVLSAKKLFLKATVIAPGINSSAPYPSYAEASLYSSIDMPPSTIRPRLIPALRFHGPALALVTFARAPYPRAGMRCPRGPVTYTLAAVKKPSRGTLHKVPSEPARGRHPSEPLSSWITVDGTMTAPVAESVSAM